MFYFSHSLLCSCCCRSFSLLNHCRAVSLSLSLASLLLSARLHYPCLFSPALESGSRQKSLTSQLTLSNEEKCPLLFLVIFLSSLMAELYSVTGYVCPKVDSGSTFSLRSPPPQLRTTRLLPAGDLRLVTCAH